MNRELRIQKLNEVKQGNPHGTGVNLPYGNKPFNTYRIPWDFLIYNKYNGRIRSLVKAYEAQYHELNPENPEDIKTIEKFLWISNESRNKGTRDNIAEFGQSRHGIVTADGKIIDGNRRAMILKDVYNERNTRWKGQDVDSCQYFVAVILDEDITDKEIRKLETIYQMGEDAKLDYNPIEKYLMVKELLDEVGFTVDDVAKWMAQNPSKIKEWRETMQLMDEYLKELQYDEIYTMLDKREDLFLSMNKYLKRYRGGQSHADWGYDTDKDVEDLKIISFDYIRAQTEGKQFRSIGQGWEGANFFSNKAIWEPFKTYHFDKVEPITEGEKAVEQWREENSGADISEVLLSRDTEWVNGVKEHLGRNFARATSKLENKQARDEPRELVEKARDALNSINTEINMAFDETIDDMLGEIIARTNKLRKLYKLNKQ